MITDLCMPEARAIRCLFGEHGWRWITERIGAHALAKDAAAVRRFQQVAACYQSLADPMQR